MDRDIALLLVGALEDIQETVETIATNTTPVTPPAGLTMNRAEESEEPAEESAEEPAEELNAIPENTTRTKSTSK